MTASANFAVPSIPSPIFYPRVKRLFESPIFLGGNKQLDSAYASGSVQYK